MSGRSNPNRIVGVVPTQNPFTPEKTGNGTWWLATLLAFHQTPGFPGVIQTMADNFFCPGECKPHFQAYLRQNPVPENPNMWFPWIVEFHNSVNRRLGKPVVSLQQATEMFSNPTVCSSCNTHRTGTKTMVLPNGGVGILEPTGYRSRNPRTTYY